MDSSRSQTNSSNLFQLKFKAKSSSFLFFPFFANTTVCAYSAVEAQRVYYHQAGAFPPAPGRHLFLANRQRTRFANGFSARLQQSTDETDEQPDNQSGGGGGGPGSSGGGTNTAGGIGAVTGGGGSTSGGDSEGPGENSIDDTQNDINQSTKGPTSRAGGSCSVNTS